MKVEAAEVLEKLPHIIKKRLKAGEDVMFSVFGNIGSQAGRKAI